MLGCFFLCAPSFCHALDSPEPPLTTWQSLSVALTYFMSLFRLVVFNSFSLYLPLEPWCCLCLPQCLLARSLARSLCLSLSLSLIQTNNKNTASSHLPLDHLIVPLGSPCRWCKFSSAYMLVMKSSEERSQSHYPYYPIISNDG